MSKRSRLLWKHFGAYVFVFFSASILFYAAFKSLDYNWNWDLIYAYRGKFFSGWIQTISISMASLFLSSVLGFVTALCLMSSAVFLRALGHAYVELIRGTPLLVQILLFFYVIAHAVGLENRYWVGVFSLSIFSAAYMAEIFRAGLSSVGKSQTDTAVSLGLTRFQTLRYVVVPQAAQVVLAPLAGQFVSLIKDSSLLSVISISELTLNAQEVNSFTYSTLESYIPLAFGYLVLTLPISLVVKRFEKRVRFET